MSKMLEFVEIGEAKRIMRCARIRIWITDAALGLAASAMCFAGILTMGLRPDMEPVGLCMLGCAALIVVVASMIWPAE